MDCAGDIADDKYFRKANDSDATQFWVLYPSIGAHLWALLWIIFELGVITGFVLLGIVCFKYDRDQMYAQAGTSSHCLFLPPSSHPSPTAEFLPT